MIQYTDSLSGITPKHLAGFFVGWPNPPSPETHLKILKNSSHFWLAIDTDTGQVVGFVNAISDRTIAAYIPLLEVLPAYHFQGIGEGLMSRILTTLKDIYMIDLVCDPEHRTGYRSLGMIPRIAMTVRNFDRQCGRA
jgi:hypothetical protein